jgi:hypothetical protein
MVDELSNEYWTVQLQITWDDDAVDRVTAIEEVRAATSGYERSLDGEQPGQVVAEILIGPTLSKDGVAQYVRARLQQAITAAGIAGGAVTVAGIRPR